MMVQRSFQTDRVAGMKQGMSKEHGFLRIIIIKKKKQTEIDNRRKGRDSSSSSSEKK